ncbi:uncharacterized protein BX663DRAFT_479036 [Cokeromyces recurvatus]|uniref:uncharacterized protein n=1 Tax=Cokeromyces recurvatus TaxID=90255 RepID=UPI00221F6A8B|nr:uncharacterized protein BX663DRAFT_479036 [Cokeromyces recurvatus]KAI7898952.1 hypothetical protein BX663DRAFT_479036 [Cokeromyces recurvatus]
MNEEFIDWDIHKSTDTCTEPNDPLSAYLNDSEEEYCSTFVKDIDDLSLTKNGQTPFIVNTTVEQIKPLSSSSMEISKKRLDIEPIPITITISDPVRKQDALQNSYISYLITTDTQHESLRSISPVRRRYQDFVWLHASLVREYPACIIPPLPERHRLEYIKGDRFSVEFIQKRLLSLQWFLDRVSRHPILQMSPCFRLFLSLTDFEGYNQEHASNISQSSLLFESISETLLNAFTKIRKPDERFQDIKEHIDRFEENLIIIERLYMRINKRQKDLQKDYSQFANSVEGLSKLETDATSLLYQFAETTKAYSSVMKEMTNIEEIQFLNEIHGLILYCHSAKVILKERDQKQIDFEGLSVHLQQTLCLRDRIQYPERKYNERGLNITEYITDKFDEIREGANIAKRNKLNKLERRINELRQDVSKTNDDLNAFSEQILEEIKIVEETKMLELKRGLLAYADCHIKFYEKGITIWEKLMSLLKKMDDIKS